MPVILWSDALIYLLILLLITAIAIGARNPLVIEKWHKVYKHPSRMICLVVLLCFALIGLLDSIHFMAKSTDNANYVQSVLDLLLQPLSDHTEKSYSAPFATNLFVKDMVKDQNGSIRWASAKLEYVYPTSIFALICKGILLASGFWFTATALLWIINKYHYKHKWNIRSPVAIAWYTFGVLLILLCVCRELMRHYHILGTDKIGEDVFYASIKSIRTGLVIGTLTTILTLPFAILFGAMAGYYRGWVDDVIQYIYTTLSSIPGVLLIAAAMLSLESIISRHEDAFALMAQRADAKLLLLCAILGITSWTSLCRILRGETLKLREQGFVLAARVIGLSDMQIIIKHVVPNLLHIILISIIIDFSGLVLAEAVLSYVGVGVDTSMYSWGNMINGARMEMGRDPVIWWTLAGAFILMFTLVLAANIFADGVRDAFDPRSE